MCGLLSTKRHYFTAAGVPLRNIATNRSALDSFAISPLLTIDCTITIPNTGKMTIFTIVTAIIAMMGKRERGRGIRRRANDAPSRMSASGTAMLPTKFAAQAGNVHEHTVYARFGKPHCTNLCQ